MTETPNYEKARAEALKLLDQFGYTSPPINPVDMARDLGIRVYFSDFEGEYDQVSGFFFAEKNEIYVNKREYPPRQTFTVAHELGHKFLHEEWLKSSNYQVLLRVPTAAAANDPREKEANTFAGNLLVPRFMLDKYYKLLKEEIASIDEVARIFVVSVPVIKVRLDQEYGR